MSLETPSGKGAGDENFPVASWLIRPDLRQAIQAFYRFARAADDIADNPQLPAPEKILRLEAMAAILRGERAEGSPAALACREALGARGLSTEHCLDLLVAFTRDATKLRYRDFGELLDYCRYSANPVGRQVLDLHGEGRRTWPASDALCTALQILNHLQDCKKDYQALDRVYLPEEMLAGAGAKIEDLAGERTPPGLRRVLDRLLEETAALLVKAGALSGLCKDPRLAAETAVIHALACRLLRLLRRRDPLAGPVKLSKGEALLRALPSAGAVLLGRLLRPQPQVSPA